MDIRVIPIHTITATVGAADAKRNVVVAAVENANDDNGVVVVPPVPLVSVSVVFVVFVVEDTMV